MKVRPMLSHSTDGGMGPAATREGAVHRIGAAVQKGGHLNTQNLPKGGEHFAEVGGVHASHIGEVEASDLGRWSAQALSQCNTFLGDGGGKGRVGSDGRDGVLVCFQEQHLWVGGDRAAKGSRNVGCEIANGGGGRERD